MVWIVACCSANLQESTVVPGQLSSGEQDTKEKKVKCAPVYVTEDEKAKHVTKAVIAQSTAPEDKKKRSSKYSVAVGSSFGHVHTFLKDSDHVLKEFDNTQAEDKCLLLIRKPKSASKQMFKAHSLATLSVQDPQLTLPDGTSAKPEPHRFFKHKTKRKTELSTPTQGGTLSKPRSQSQGSPVSVRSSAADNDRTSTSDSVSGHYRTSETKFSYLYPYDEMFNRKSSDLMKSKSNSDITQENKEINNNRMGGGFTKSRPSAAPPAVPTKSNVSANRTRTSVSDDIHKQNHALDKTNNNNRPDILSNVDSKLRSAQSFSDNIHTATNTLWKSSRSQAKYSGNVSENWHSEARQKHDSGFHSDITSPNEKVQYSTFRSELSSNHLYLNDKNMASSSTPLDQGASFGIMHLEKQPVSDKSPLKEQNSSLNANGQDQQGRACVRNQTTNGINANVKQSRHVNNSDGLLAESKCVRNPQINQRTHPYSSNSGLHHGSGNKTERQVSPKTQCVQTGNVNHVHSHHQTSGHVHKQRIYDGSHTTVHEHTSNAGHTVKHAGHTAKHAAHHSPPTANESCLHKGRTAERNSSSGSGCSKRHSLSPKQTVVNGHTQINKAHSPREYSQNATQSWADVSQLKTGNVEESSIHVNDSKTQEEVKDNFEKEDPVLRAHSLGDLTAGCTFSVVGQKKAGSVQALTETEFTGSQLAKHFRKYREMKPEIIHGSLPGRMKCMGTETKARPKLENMNYQQENNLQIYNSGMNGHCKKQKHYGSLQHLPLSETKDHRDMPSIRNREKTPIKPRRTLPQVPGDVDEKKKQYTDMVKLRLASRNSSSPSSGNSNTPNANEPGTRPLSCEAQNRPQSGELRPGGISATPSFSDKEVSELLERSARDPMWVKPTYGYKCNKVPHQKSDIIPPDAVYDKLAHSYPSYNAGAFMQHDNTNPQSRTRHCESGQNTITSQSTVDSGYITNDPEPENNTTLSTSSYARSLKESSNKLFKPSKGEHTNMTRQHRDHDTRNWIERHPGSYLKEVKPNIKGSVKEDINAEKEPYLESGSRTASDKENMNPKLAESSYVQQKTSLTHRVSEISSKEAEKFGQERKYFRPKVKAVSMSYGLNLIESNNNISNSGLLRSQPKFTGSLMNLTHPENQDLNCAPSLDSLKAEVKNATLPGSWKFFGGNQTESSPKKLGQPSLFQLLQNYSIHPVKLKIPENFTLLDSMRLIECEVVLPSPWSGRRDSGTVTSPKGSYAKLGGPNSAFKPVVAGSASVRSVSMVTIVDISSQMTDLYELGQINKGDLIVEVNERLVIGDDFRTLTNLLQACQGEMLLTVARDKARERQKMTITKEEDLRKMEARIAHLTKEMRKKDRTLKQLNSLLPWKQLGDSEKNIDMNSEEICNLSEDEFIV